LAYDWFAPSAAYNCVLVGNSADVGGGAHCVTLRNSIIYFNTATNGPNYSYLWDDGTTEGPADIDHGCTVPLPPDCAGNITNTPLFVDYAGGNLRLQSNSPCINAGNNAYGPEPTDLEGNARIVSGTVDIGASEFQGLGSIISYAWLQQYGFPTDGAADHLDSDADGMDTWQEWRCLTVPTNALSALRLVSAQRAGNNVIVTWQSVSGLNYCLERSASLESLPQFGSLAGGLLGEPGTTSYTDTNTASLNRLFYRVRVP
jgi:hypothetical protein